MRSKTTYRNRNRYGTATRRMQDDYHYTPHHSRENDFNRNSVGGNYGENYEGDFDHMGDNTRMGYNEKHYLGGQGNFRGRHRHDDDENVFERAGRKIKETWNDWTDRDEDDRDDYYENQYNYRGRYNNPYADYDSNRYVNEREERGGRNFFERAGDKIREKWNDWTDRDDDRDERRYEDYDDYRSGYVNERYNRVNNDNYRSSGRAEREYDDNDRYYRSTDRNTPQRSRRTRRNEYSW